MREILFRGQTRRYGEKVNMAGKKLPSKWVYGGIFPGTGDFSVIYDMEKIEKYVVYSDTVGQYTGLTDKNGKKIFEGDIIENIDGRSIVFFDKIPCGLYMRFLDAYDDTPLDMSEMWDDPEVIGNIHDNPELLGDNHAERT